MVELKQKILKFIGIKTFKIQPMCFYCKYSHKHAFSLGFNYVCDHIGCTHERGYCWLFEDAEPINREL